MDFLKCYVKNTLNPAKDSIGEAISEIKPQGISIRSEWLEPLKKGITTNVCPHCGYVKPFCYFHVVKECSNIMNNGENVPRGT